MPDWQKQQNNGLAVSELTKQLANEILAYWRLGTKKKLACILHNYSTVYFISLLVYSLKL
jgi:hypothetical protein